MATITLNIPEGTAELIRKQLVRDNVDSSYERLKEGKSLTSCKLCCSTISIMWACMSSTCLMVVATVMVTFCLTTNWLSWSSSWKIQKTIDLLTLG